MKNFLFLLPLILMMNSCSALSELQAFTKCEFRLLSVQDPFLCDIDVSQKNNWTDFSFSEGSRLAGQLLNKSLPFNITVNVEARNPGTTAAAVSSIEWIAYIDDLQVAQGMVKEQVKVAPSGGRTLIRVKVDADLIDYLEGDNPNSLAISLLLRPWQRQFRTSRSLSVTASCSSVWRSGHRVEDSPI